MLIVALIVSGGMAACGSRTAIDAQSEGPRMNPPEANRSPGHDAAVSHNQKHPSDPGCSDGEREGFTDATRYPDIAGCSGAWTVPGIHTTNPGTAPACGVRTHDTQIPSCARSAGDDGATPTGQGCSVADLCAAGWHVCNGAADVAVHSPDGCAGVVSAGDPPMFFATRQSSNGCGVCATGTRIGDDCNSVSCTPGCAQTAALSNDFFGCGNYGATSPIVDCAPLDRFSNDQCADLPGWTCPDSFCEAFLVTKATSEFGGVLCCRD
jgi:hypothetical protein